MGTFATRIGVTDGNGGPTRWVEAMVDTGASHSVFPETLLREEIGIRPKRFEDFQIADGSQITLPVGEVRIVVEGREAYTPVVFGSENRYLLGATTLQVLGLFPDTSHHKLIPTPISYL